MARKVIRRARGEYIKISGEALIRVSRRVTLTIVAPSGTRVERAPSKDAGEAPLQRRDTTTISTPDVSA